MNELEHSGLIRRVFGGATLIVGSDKQVPLFVLEREFGKEKDKLCEQAASFISDGNILFIDGSSTMQFLVPYLSKFNNLVVITNGLKIAQMLSEIHIKVYIAGGLLMENSSVITGHDTEKFIDNFNADICFLSYKGLSDDGKLIDTSSEETKSRKYYLKNANKKNILMTSNKVGKKYILTLCNVEEVDHLLLSNPLT